jgi:putative methionine-R-sulfoxide reductase with GAF domain
MDRYSILDQSGSGNIPFAPSTGGKQDSGVPEGVSPKPLRFPGDDAGTSLADMAQRDLDAALHLLAERAQYITGASGAAIALREPSKMICRASTGPSALELGSELQLNSGLTGESVRTRQLLRCDDAERDFRANRESCRALGIKSVMVMPLIRESEVIGVFELLADRVYAFEPRDVTALERLGEMVLTALEHADAAGRALNEIATKADQASPEDKNSAPPLKNKEVISPVEYAAFSQETTLNADLPTPVPVREAVTIGECEGCGFPVSEGRTLCVDCEAAQIAEGNAAPAASGQAPVFLSQLAAQRAGESWLRSNIYTIGALLVAALTVVILLSRLR